MDCLKPSVDSLMLINYFLGSLCLCIIMLLCLQNGLPKPVLMHEKIFIVYGFNKQRETEVVRPGNLGKKEVTSAKIPCLAIGIKK